MTQRTAPTLPPPANQAHEMRERARQLLLEASRMRSRAEELMVAADALEEK